MDPNEVKILEKKAQIKILDYLPNHLCNSELSEKGRKALRGITNRLNEEINDIRNPPNKAQSCHRN